MQLYDRRTAPRRADSWFVYCLVDARSPTEIRYIGITNQPRVRLAAHLSRAPHEGWHKSNWVRSVVSDGSQVLMGLLAGGLSHGDAVEAEIYLIALHREMGSRLTNLTDGGEGVSGSKQSAETKAKKSAALAGRPFSAEHKRNLSTSLRGLVASDEARRNMSAAHLRRYADPAQRERQREGCLRRLQDPAVIEQYRQSTTKRFEDPIERRKQSARSIEMHKDPSIRERAVITKAKRGPQSNNKLGLKGVRFDERGRFFGELYT